MAVDTIIYTTGAYLVPKRVKINGKWVWAWVVTHFEDDSFRNGDEFNPPETAKNKRMLLKNTTPPLLPIGKSGVTCKGGHNQ